MAPSTLRIIFLVFTALTVANAATVYVSPGGSGDGSSGSPFGSLAAAVASSPTAIVMNAGTHLVTSVTTISGGEFSITGTAGSTFLSSDGSSQFLKIQGGAKITVNGLRFSGGVSADNGGAISVTGSSSLTVSGCEFLGNKAATNGGAIFQDSGALSVTNTKFIGNNVTSVVLDKNALGGAIACVGSTFTSIVVTTSTFTTNAVKSPIGSYGGAIAVQDTTVLASITDSTFTSNTALYGGGVSFKDTNAANVVSNSKFTANTATDTALLDAVPGFAGGIYAETATATVNLASEIKQSSAVRGGALAARYNAVLTCDGCVLDANTASKFGGHVTSESSSTVTLNACTISNGHAAKGGAVYNKQAKLLTTNVDFNTNKAVETAGTFYLVKVQQISITGGNVDGSECESAVGGGALYSDSVHSGEVKFSGVTFKNNKSPTGPGGAAVLYGHKTVSYVFEGCTFTANYAYQMGGAIAAWNLHGSMTGTSFVSNTVGATEEGASLYLSAASAPSLSGCTFSNHVSASTSSVLMVENSAPTVHTTTFTANKGHGSVAVVTEGSSPSFVGSIFSHNTGLDTGPSSALLIDGFGNTTVVNSTFNDNRSPGGSAMSIGVRAKATITRTHFNSNLAKMSGGAVIVNSSVHAAAFSACSFTANRANGSAGALMLSAGSIMAMLDGEFTGNHADFEGGAVYVGVASKIQVQHSSFTSNTAGLFGGAITFDEETTPSSSSTTMQADSTFKNNFAESGGGATYWHIGTPTTTVQTCSSCVYNGNSVGVNGYGPDRATDVSTVTYPTTSQHAFTPGIPSDNVSFYLNVVDKFNQRVKSTSGSGIQCAVSWASTINQFGGDTVRFSKNGLITFPEVRLAALADSTAISTFECSYARCSATDPSVVQHKITLTSTIVISKCQIGQYREMEEVLQPDADGLNQLVQTGRVKNCKTCPKGKFSMEQGVTECEDCPVGGECPGGNVLIPKEGYWKTSPDDDSVYKCTRDGCLGGVESACKEGYHGLVCGICDEEYAVFGHSCESCSGGTGQILLHLPVICLVVSLLGAAWLAHTSQDDLQAKKFVESIYSEKLRGMAQVFVSYIQILALIIYTISGVPWPDAFRGFVSILSFAQLNLFQILPLDCYRSGKFSFYDGMVCSMILPASAFVYYSIKAKRGVSALGVVSDDEATQMTEMTDASSGMYTPSATPRSQNAAVDSDDDDFTDTFTDTDDSDASGGLKLSKDARSPMVKKYDAVIGENLKSLVTWLFILYPGSCSQLMSTFFCRKIGGSSYLVADVEYECYDGMWAGWAMLAIAGIFMFLVAFPVATFAFLWKNKAERNKSSFHAKYGYLYTSYKVDCWHTGSMECLRKMLLVGAIVFFSPGSPTQTALAFCVAYFFLMYHIKMAPYNDSSVNRMELIAESTLTMTLFAGLGLQAHMCKDEDGASRMIVAGFLVMSNCLAGIMMITLIMQYLNKQRLDIAATRRAVIVWSNLCMGTGWRHWRQLYLSGALEGSSHSSGSEDESDNDFDSPMFGTAIQGALNPLRCKADPSDQVYHSQDEFTKEDKPPSIPEPDPAPERHFGRSLKDIIRSRNSKADDGQGVELTEVEEPLPAELQEISPVNTTEPEQPKPKVSIQEKLRLKRMAKLAANSTDGIEQV